MYSHLYFPFFVWLHTCIHCTLPSYSAHA